MLAVILVVIPLMVSRVCPLADNVLSWKVPGVADGLLRLATATMNVSLPVRSAVRKEERTMELRVIEQVGACRVLLLVAEEMVMVGQRAVLAVVICWL